MIIIRGERKEIKRKRETRSDAGNPIAKTSWLNMRTNTVVQVRVEEPSVVYAGLAKSQSIPTGSKSSFSLMTTVDDLNGLWIVSFERRQLASFENW